MSARCGLCTKTEEIDTISRALSGGDMRLKGYQLGELIGVALVLLSTAAQLFYLEPLKREIEWRLVAFNIQQSGQIQTKTLFSNQLAVLRAVNASSETMASAEKERDATIAQYQTADANLSDYLFEKEAVENRIQMLVIGLFVFGSLLTFYGRLKELRAQKS